MSEVTTTSESTTEPTPPTSTTVAEPALPDVLREKLKDAPAPLTLKELTKGLKRPAKQKAAEFEAAIAEILAADVESRTAFKHGSGKAGVERYWARDEREAIRAAVLDEATQPRKLAELKKKAKETTKADKAFAEPIVDELVTTEQLHKQSAAANPLYGKEKPRDPNDRPTVTAAIIAAAEPPQNAANLVKAATKQTKADKGFVESIVEELIREKQLHPQSSANKPLYGKHAPHLLDVEPGKKAFTALVKAGHKLREIVPDVPLDDLVQRFRVAVERPPATPQVEPPLVIGPELAETIRELKEHAERVKQDPYALSDAQVDEIVTRFKALKLAEKKAVIQAVTETEVKNADDAVLELRSALMGVRQHLDSQNA